MATPRNIREEVISEVRAGIQALSYDSEWELHRSCLDHAALVSLALAKRGIRAIMQAGSASFQFKGSVHDDGGPTHISYEFSPSDHASARRLAVVALPEIHVWACIPKTQEIIDPTTKYLPKLLATSLPGEQWTAEPPVDCIWATGQNMPAGYLFSASLDAVYMAYRFLEKGRPHVFAEMQRRGVAPRYFPEHLN